jgi:HAD superfamily hydrolase (TIGR01509 family)
MKQLKMIVFDLDGVILDSEPLHEHAKIRILKEHGITEKVDLSFSVGQPNKMLWHMMINRFHINKSEEALEKLQYEYILEEIKDKQIPTSIGLMELLQYLKNNEIKIGLASSSDRFYVDAILKYYNILDYFEYIVAGDEVKRKKPEPDIYLKIMELSQLKANEVNAIEDSYAGSKAATQAGLKCIGYHNPTSGNQDLSNCYLKINEMSQVVDIICNT